MGEDAPGFPQQDFRLLGMQDVKQLHIIHSTIGNTCPYGDEVAQFEFNIVQSCLPGYSSRRFMILVMGERSMPVISASSE